MSYIKIDLHTHSIVSRDGGLDEKDYSELLRKHIADVIAITDHNTIDFARLMKKRFNDQIIIGEEIRTKQGEIIGLYLNEHIPPDLTIEETIRRIRLQKGLTYIPHPFETRRIGVQNTILQKNVENIDVVEVFNGRSLGNRTNHLANKFVLEHRLAAASSSDAHCRLGVGNSFTSISEVPNANSLVNLLKHGIRNEKHSPALSYICPSLNRIRKLFLRK